MEEEKLDLVYETPKLIAYSHFAGVVDGLASDYSGPGDDHPVDPGCMGVAALPNGGRYTD